MALDRTTVVAVCSGKGGVGKSTISLNLALALAAPDCRVGVLDADFYGPDIPLMVNLTRRAPLRGWMMWRREDAGGSPRLEPVERFGVEIMSVGFLLAEQQSFLMPTPLLDPVIHQLVHDVAWNDPDYLIVDLPPGTGDLQQKVMELLAPAGAVVVVTPQDVAHLDAKRVIDMLNTRGVRVLGAVENMASYSCPHCGAATQIFPHVAPERAIWANGVHKLGEIPLDPGLARAGEAGEPVVVADPNGPRAEAFRSIAAAVVNALG